MFFQLNATYKTVRNPCHLWCFFQNVNIIRDHIQALYRKVQDWEALELGVLSELSWIHVVLRTTDFVMKDICLASLGWTLTEHLHRSDLSPVQMRLSREV